VAKPSEGEARTLDEAGPLLRFAAEHVKNLDPDLSLALAEAHDAAQNGAWTPQISQRFWNAFGKLCQLVQPVTTDCLAAAQRDLALARWVPWKADPSSIAERSSRRYLAGLLLLLALVLPLQLYVWTCTSLSKKIDELIGTTKQKVVQLSEDFTKIGNKSAKNGVFDDRGEAFKAKTLEVEIDLERINYLLDILQHTGKVGFVDRGYNTDFKSWLQRSDLSLDTFNDKIAFHFEDTQHRIRLVQQKQNLAVTLIGSFLLPILFGTIGAVAYIIRTISEQIQSATFSTTSPIRHVMRAGLGALAGVVVGLFSDVSERLSLQPLAIAFLAGYGAEAVFAMFDSLAAKFRLAVQGNARGTG
jgi:hypothetical protein